MNQQIVFSCRRHLTQRGSVLDTHKEAGSSGYQFCCLWAAEPVPGHASLLSRRGYGGAGSTEECGQATEGRCPHPFTLWLWAWVFLLCLSIRKTSSHYSCGSQHLLAPPPFQNEAHGGREPMGARAYGGQRVVEKTTAIDPFCQQPFLPSIPLLTMGD